MSESTLTNLAVQEIFGAEAEHYAHGLITPQLAREIARRVIGLSFEYASQIAREFGAVDVAQTLIVEKETLR